MYIRMWMTVVYRYLHRYTYVHNYRAAVCDIIYPKAGFLPGGKTTVCLYSDSNGSYVCTYVCTYVYSNNFIERRFLKLSFM